MHTCVGVSTILSVRPSNASTSNTDVHAHGGARVTDVLNLGKKKREESRSFHQAVGYYAGLCRFYGRELSAAELGFRGRSVEVLEAIKGAVDS